MVNASRMPGATKLRWSDQEVADVVTRLPRHSDHKPTKHEILLAQEILPPARRRTVIGYPLINLLDRVRAQALRDGTLPRETPAPAAAPAPPPAAEAQEEPAAPEPQALPEPVARLADLPTFILEAELADRRQSSLERFQIGVLAELRAITAALRQLIPRPAPKPTGHTNFTDDYADGPAPAVPLSDPGNDVPPAPPKPKAPPRPRTKRVVVIGPLPEQFHHLCRKFPALDLTLLDKSKNPDVSRIPASSDAVVIDTRFMNHKWTATAKAFCERAGITYLEGFGRTGLERNLEYVLKN
jgi:hypothetical protein